jgi:aryl-alcohol dehydrogenase-like predicted oxidoreductase
MNLVELGTTGIESSALALGCELLGSKTDKQAAFSLLDSFFDHGGTLLNTANYYGNSVSGGSGGESETTIGAWMKERGIRDKVLVSSKLGSPYSGSAGGLSKSEIASECEKSLKRLQTDHLDIYYAHGDDRAIPQDETVEALDALVRDGKVRILGASNMPVWSIAQANTISRAHGYATYQLIEQFYTYARPHLGADAEPVLFLTNDTKSFAQSYGIGLIASSALLSGAYASFHLPTRFAGNDSDERMAVLIDVSAQVGFSRNQVVIAWLRQSSPSVLPVVTASSVEQLKESIDALKLVLTSDEMEYLTTAGNPNMAEKWLQSK